MTATDTIKENLFGLQNDVRRLTDLALYELSELSRTAFDAIKEPLAAGEWDALISQSALAAFQSTFSFTEGTPDAYEPFLREADEGMRSLRIAAFCAFLSERIREALPGAFPWEERICDAPRIAYVPLGRTEDAFLYLSQIKKGAAVFYVQNAEDAARAVIAQKADYALLPYVAANGERLSSTAHLAARHDLFLSALITVGEGEQKLSYALFSKDPSPFAETDRMHFDVRVTLPSFSALGKLFSLFSVLGFSQTDFVPEKEEYGRVCGRVTLTGNGDVIAMWICFSLLSVGFSFMGRYPVMEAVN